MRLSMGNFEIGDGISVVPGVEIHPIVLDAPAYEEVQLATEETCEIPYEESADFVPGNTVSMIGTKKDVLLPRGVLISGDWASKFPLEDLWMPSSSDSYPLFGCAINGYYDDRPDPSRDWIDPREYPEVLKIERLRLPFSVVAELHKAKDLNPMWDVINDRMLYQEYEEERPSLAENMSDVLNDIGAELGALPTHLSGVRGFVITVSGSIAHLEILPNQSISNQWLPVLLKTAVLEQRYDNWYFEGEESPNFSNGDSHVDVVEFVSSTFRDLENLAVVSSDWTLGNPSQYSVPTDRPLPWTVELATDSILASGKALLRPDAEVLIPGHIEVTKRRSWPQM